MTITPDNQLYERVVEVTRFYLGPAADRFIARQITNHLHKQPERLTTADLPMLIDWLKLSMAFLTDDERLIEQFIDDLRTISHDKLLKPNSRERRMVYEAGGR